MKQKIRPCDCKDKSTAWKLKEQGISHNENSLSLQPNIVKMKIGHTTIEIPMYTFKLFSEWYLAEQEETDYILQEQ